MNNKKHYHEVRIAEPSAYFPELSITMGGKSFMFSSIWVSQSMLSQKKVNGIVTLTVAPKYEIQI